MTNFREIYVHGHSCKEIGHSGGNERSGFSFVEIGQAPNQTRMPTTMRTTKLRLALVLLLSVWTNVLTASSTNVEQAEEDARETAKTCEKEKDWSCCSGGG